MKTPPNLYEAPRELDRQIVNSLINSPNLLAELRCILADKTHSFHRLPMCALRLLMDKLDELLEEAICRLRSEPQLDMSNLLGVLMELVDYEIYCKLFYMVEHLLNLLGFSDRLEYFPTTMRILLKVYMQEKANQTYLKDYIPRIVYLTRFFFDHSNSLSPHKLELFDYYHDDPNYSKICTQPIECIAPKFHMEFLVPTLLLESYEELHINQKHKFTLLQGSEMQSLQIDDLQQAIKDANSPSLLEFSRNVLKSNKIIEEDQANHYSPLCEVIKYRLLMHTQLQLNPISAKLHIIELHFIALEVYLTLDSFCQNLQVQQDFLDQVFAEKIDFARYFEVYGKLFYLQSPPPEFIISIIRTLDGILSMDALPEYDECFNIAKEYDETFLQLIFDVLSGTRISIEVEGSTPIQYACQMISEHAARNEKVACGALKLFSSETGVMLLSRNNIALGASQALVKALSQQQQTLTLTPEVIKHAIKLLGRLSRKEELLRDLNLVDEMLRLADQYVDLLLSGQAIMKPSEHGWVECSWGELELNLIQTIQSMNEHFKDEEGRRNRNNRANAPTIARKIAETSLPKKLKQLIEKKGITNMSTLIQQILLLMSHISNEVPTLIGRLMDSHLPICVVGQVLSTNQFEGVNGKQIEVVLGYFSNISLKEEGFEAFNGEAMKILRRLLKSVLQSPNSGADVMLSMANSIFKYLHKIDKVQKQVCELIMDELVEYNQQLKERRAQILSELNVQNRTHCYNQYQQLLQSLNNFSIFTVKLTYPNHTHLALLADMCSRNLVERMSEFLKFPIFEQRNELSKAFRQLTQADEYETPGKILKILCAGLEQLELKCGIKLDKGGELPIDEQFYNAETFFNNVSVDSNDVQRKFEIISHFSYVEQLLDIFKNSQNPYASIDNKTLAATALKCAGLMLIVVKVIANTPLKEGEPIKIENIYCKHKLYPLMSTLKSLLIQIYRQQKKKQNPDDLVALCTLFTQLASQLKNSIHIATYYAFVLRDLAQQLITSKHTQDNVLSVEFVAKLQEMHFYDFMKCGVSHFYQQLGQDTNKDALDLMALQLQRVVTLMYLNKMEVQKGQSKDAGYNIVLSSVDELEFLLTISCGIKSEVHQPILDVVLQKADQLMQPTFLTDIVIEQQKRKEYPREGMDFFGNREYDTMQEEEFNNVVQQLVQMGYTQNVSQVAVSNIEYPDIHLAIQWMEANQDEVMQQELQMELENVGRVEQQFNNNNNNNSTNYQEAFLVKIKSLRTFLLKHLIYFKEFDFSRLIDKQGLLNMLLRTLKHVVQGMSPKFVLKFKEVDSIIEIPKEEHMSAVRALLHHILRVSRSDKEYDGHLLSSELMRLATEIIKTKDDEHAPHCLNMILATYYFYISGPMNEQPDESKKKRKKEPTDFVQDNLVVILSVVRSKCINATTSKIIIDILVRSFQINHANIQYFLLHLKGLEALLKVKGADTNVMHLLCKLVLQSVHDPNLVRAQLECKIKRILFDQEYNKEIEHLEMKNKVTEIKQQQQLQTEQQVQSKQFEQPQQPQQPLQPQGKQSLEKHVHDKHIPMYPQTYTPNYHPVTLPNEITIPINHPQLLLLQQYTNQSEDYKYVVSQLFDVIVEQIEKVEKVVVEKVVVEKVEQPGDKIVEESIVESPVPPPPQTLLRLKRGLHLYALDCVPASSFQKFQDEPIESQPRKTKQSTQKKKKSEDKMLTITNTQSNFQHTHEFQILVKTLISQLIVAFCEDEEYQFHWYSIIQVLHVLIRKYPILIPKIMKINCYKFIKPYTHKMQHLQKVFEEIPKKLSFLTFLTQVMVPPTGDKLKHFLFELCLDNVLLHATSTHIVPFSLEIRKKVLGEMHNALDYEFRRRGTGHRPFDSKENMHNIVTYSNLLVYLLQIKSVARLAFRNVTDSANSYNFVKLYIDAFKSVPIQGYYTFDKVLDFITETLAVLYSVGVYNLTHNKPHKSPEPLSIQDGIIGQLHIDEIQCQVIPKQQITYKDGQKLFNTWPLPPLSFFANRPEQQEAYGFEFQFLRGNQLLGQPRQGSRRNRMNNIDLVIDDGQGEGEIMIDGDMVFQQEDEEESMHESSGQQQFDSHSVSGGDSWVTSSGQSNQIQQENSEHSDSWTDGEESESGEDDGEQDEDDGNDDQIEEEMQSMDDVEQVEDMDDMDMDDEDDMDDDDIDGDDDEDDDEDDQGQVEGEEIEIQEEEQQKLAYVAMPSTKEDLAFMKMIKQIVCLENLKFPPEFVKILTDLKIVMDWVFEDVKIPTETLSMTWQNELLQKLPAAVRDESDRSNLGQRFPHYFNHPNGRLGMGSNIFQNNGGPGGNLPVGANMFNSTGNNLAEAEELLGQFEHHFDRYHDFVRLRALHSRAAQRNPNHEPRLQQLQQLQQLHHNPQPRQQAHQIQVTQIQQQQRPQIIQEELQQSLLNFDWINVLQSVSTQNEQQRQQQQQQPQQQGQQRGGQLENAFRNLINQHQQQQQPPQQPQQQQPPQIPQQPQQQPIPSQSPMPLQPPQQPQFQQPEQQFEQMQIIPQQQLEELSQQLLSRLQGNQAQSEQQPEQPQQQQQQQPQQEQQPQQSQQQTTQFPRVRQILDRFNRSFEILVRNDVDPMTLEDLPEDIIMDIILNLPNSIEGIDEEFMNSLPQEIQQELRQQTQVQNQQQSNVNVEMDTATFIQTLTPDLREEILLTLSNDILETLPIDIRNEAIEIRMRANSRVMYRIERQDDQSIHQQQQQQLQQQQQQKRTTKDHQNLLKVKELLLKDKHLNNKLGTVDDEFAEALLSMLYTEPHSFVYFPINLFITLTNNPLVEQKIVDAMFFILKSQNDMPQLKLEAGLREDQFPLTFIIERNGIMKDYNRAYQNVSLKILFLLSKMQNIQSAYFFEQRRTSSLASIQRMQGDTQQIPLFQLIYLLPRFNGVHQELLIEAISNLTKLKQQTDMLRLDEQGIECMCKMLLQPQVLQKTVKQFSSIITNLCGDEQNLQQFLQYIKGFISAVTKEINQKFEDGRTVDEIFKGEKSLINVFQFIKELIDKEQSKSTDQEPSQSAIRSSFQELLEDGSLRKMWQNLAEMLSQLSTQQLARCSSKISPFLECFFIIYQMISPQIDLKKRYLPKKDKPTKIAQMEIQNQSQSSQTHDELFQTICERGKMLLNLMIKEKLQEIRGRDTGERTKNILYEPIGIIFLKAPKIIDFENKQKYFKQELKQLKASNRHYYHGGINLRLRRKDIFMDSYKQFQNVQTERLKGKMNVEFVGEEGVDAGGVTREWFLVLSREMFNANYVLFTPSLNGQMFQPSNMSHVNPEHVKFFKFIGRVVGKALYDGHLLDTYFTRSFYKHILGQPLTIHDMEDIDLNEYNSMKKILESKNVNEWGIYWNYTVDNFGKFEERELVEGGKTKLVTEENKVEYVQTYCYQKMAKEIKDQIEAFLSGFHELIPQSLVSIFEWKEMELMLCGLPDIDLEDMKENVEYNGFTANDKIIVWLWELLESYDKSKRASFLQFITGTSKVPLGGFKELRGMHGPQKMQVHKKPYVNYDLPTSHTCFNQLDLPEYPTRQVLKEKLELAILEGKEGFGFA